MSVLKQVDYNVKLLIGTPLVPWKAARNEHKQWLRHREEVCNTFKNASYFAALEYDGGGLREYGDFLEELRQWNVTYWSYLVNDNDSTVNFANRLIRIETGRNLVREYAQRNLYDAVLYVDSDLVLTLEHVQKMAEVDHPLVSVDVPAYCLSGHVVHENPRIEEHWNTAGVLYVNGPYYYDLPWYHNVQLGLSDDPTFQHLAQRLYSQTWVRKDTVAVHEGQLVSLEERNIKGRVYVE